MEFHRKQRLLGAGAWCLEKLSTTMLLSLPGPLGCLLYSGRIDSQVCRLFLAGSIFLLCAAVCDFAAQRVQALWSYIGICLCAAAATGFLALGLGLRWLERSMRLVLLLETIFAVSFLSLTSLQVRMREKRRKTAMRENDITWVENSVMFERPSVFGILLFTGAYILSLFTNCPAFCDLSLYAGVLYTLIFLIHRCIQHILESWQEYRHLTHVPADKMLRQYTGFVAVLVMLVCLSAVPSLMTGEFRSYRDIRDWRAENPISPEDMRFPEMEGTGYALIPHPDIEKGEYHPVPGWYKPVEYLLTGAILLLMVALVLRAIRKYAFSFRGRMEENGDIALSLAEDETQRIRIGVRNRRKKEEGEREKIRKNYRRTIRRFRRRGELPSGFETPTRIEEETAFPDGYDLASLHEKYIIARYGNHFEKALVKADTEK